MRLGISVAVWTFLVSWAAVAQPCPDSSKSAKLADIAKAVKFSSTAPQDVKVRSCMWAGAAIAESGGNLCASNGYNFGVLQLSRANVERLGLTPEAYMDLSLQEQIDGWALAGASVNNGSEGYKKIDSRIATISPLGHVLDGVLAACSQFGAAICKNNIDTIESGKALPIPNSPDAIPCKDVTCQHGTANQDGNGQTIVSWGLQIQGKIHLSQCVDN